MAPSGGDLDCYILRFGNLGDHSLQETWKNCASIRLEESGPEQLLALRLMAATGSRMCASSSTDGNSGRARWRPSLGNPEKTEADNSQGGDREMSPSEGWITMENSLVKRRALPRLEKELEATLLFEHGGEYRASPHWVTRILLGRLFPKRLSLDRAVKSFPKFQRKEMMCGLVKLNELEEVTEPSLGGNQERSVSRLPRDEPMDMEAEDVALEEVEEDAWFSPGES